MWILICETVSLPTVCGWETDYLCLPPQPLSKVHVGGTRNLKEKGSGNGAGGGKSTLQYFIVQCSPIFNDWLINWFDCWLLFMLAQVGVWRWRARGIKFGNVTVVGNGMPARMLVFGTIPPLITIHEQYSTFNIELISSTFYGMIFIIIF